MNTVIAREKIKTYTLEGESGASLRAAGWVQEELLPARSGWNCNSRQRPNDPSPREAKIRWRAA